MSDSAASVAKTEQLAPWRSALLRALHRNRSKPYSRYFQLATVHSNGYPANRTVVFRGFFPKNNGLMFVSDGRSQKVEDAIAHPFAEVCWYFTHTREQFRLAGRLVLIDAQASNPILLKVRQRLWEDLSNQSRLQFYWPHPGQERTAGEARFEPPTPAADVPPEAFSLGILQPTSVDHLELRGNPQTRTYYGQTADQTWYQKELNP